MIVSQEIKNQIIGKIEGLASVQKVYPAVKLNPSGYPCVYVTANREEGEFSSNAENSRVYEYNCMVLFPIGQDYIPDTERERMDYAEFVIAEVLDQIINVIDTDYELDGSPVLYVNAADIEWGYTDVENGAARAANVILRVYTEITV